MKHGIYYTPYKIHDAESLLVINGKLEKIQRVGNL